MSEDHKQTKARINKTRLLVWLAGPTIILLIAIGWTIRTWNYGIGGVYFDPSGFNVIVIRDYGVGVYSLSLPEDRQRRMSPGGLQLERVDDGKYRLFQTRSFNSSNQSWDLLAEFRRGNDGVFQILSRSEGSDEWITGLIPLYDESVGDLIIDFKYGKMELSGFLEEFHLRADTKPQLLLYELFKADRMIRSQDIAGVRDQLEKLRAMQGDLDLHILDAAISFYEQWLRGMEKEEEGLNYSERINNWISPTAEAFDLEEFSDLISSMRTEAVIIPTDVTFLLPSSSAPNFLMLQTMTKLYRVLSDFALFAGDPFEALSITLRPLSIGILMKRDGNDLISILIGTAMTSISAASLENVLLNGFRTPAQFEYVWPVVRRVHEMDVEATTRYSVLQRPYHGRTSVPPNQREALIRMRVSNVNIATAISAGAARQQLLADPNWQPTREDFGMFLPEGPLPDPFVNFEEPLQVVRVGQIRWRVYSIGPDQQDDKALIAYDPTNGMISRGDLWSPIRRDREYPFPPPNSLPTTRDAILRLFPEGLPPDPFADWKGSSYVVTDHEPAWILSWGPDVDQSVVREGEIAGDARRRVARGRPISTFEDIYITYRPFDLEQHYDPVNGTISQGDVYINSALPDADFLEGNIPPTPTPLPNGAPRN